MFIQPCRSKITSNLRVTGLCAGNSPWTGEFPAQMASNDFCVPCDLEIWWMTSKNIRTPLLCHRKLYASFCSHVWIQTGVTVRKCPNWGKILFLTPVTVTFDLEVTFVYGYNSWKFPDDTMPQTLWKGRARQTDRQTERSVLRATWSQLKAVEWLESTDITTFMWGHYND